MNQRLGLQPSYWDDIIDGISSYVTQLREQITRAHIKTSTRINSLEYRDNCYFIKDSNGTVTEVDHLIIATNAHQAQHLLKTIAHAKEVRDALGAIDYIYTTIAVHEDQRFMPLRKSEWSVANVWYNGSQSTLTIYKEGRSNVPVFRSWVMPGFPFPRSLHALKNYYHAIPNKTYFETQDVLDRLSGENNLWIAGIYTHDIDSHESALFSAVKIVKKIMPTSHRLQLLCQDKK